MKINILAGSIKLGRALRRYLVHVLGLKGYDCSILMLTDNIALSQDILKTDLWIIEAWHPFEPDNPVGFRTAYKLAGSIKSLLFFYDVPVGFPEDGFFWCNPLTCEFKIKIKEVAESELVTKADFEQLIELWPALAYDSTAHHHFQVNNEFKGLL